VIVSSLTPGAVAPPLDVTVLPPWFFHALSPSQTGTHGGASTDGTSIVPRSVSQRSPQS